MSAQDVYKPLNLPISSCTPFRTSHNQHFKWILHFYIGHCGEVLRLSHADMGARVTQGTFPSFFLHWWKRKQFFYLMDGTLGSLLLLMHAPVTIICISRKTESWPTVLQHIHCTIPPRNVAHPKLDILIFSSSIVSPYYGHGHGRKAAAEHTHGVCQFTKAFLKRLLVQILNQAV